MTRWTYASSIDQASTPDRAWLAGLLEGEGCFRYGTGGIVQLAMTDKDVVERAAAMMCGRVDTYPSKPPRKEQYKVRIGGVRARAVMETVLPFMGERRAAKIIKLLAMPNWGFPDRRGRLTVHN